MSNKLLKLLDNYKACAVFTSQHLRDIGISRQLVQVYIKSGWLEPLAPNAYKRPKDPITWAGGVYALQKQLNLPVHVSGFTALELHNIRHHISVADQEIFLTGNSHTSIPRWFVHLWGKNLRYNRSSLFEESSLGLETIEVSQLPLVSSIPERAFLEILSSINEEFVFEEASSLISGFLSWNVPTTKDLLSKCKSNKAKRLLLFLGKHHKIDALMEVAASNPDVGKGKIQIVKNGYFDTEFQITVPVTFKDEKYGSPF